MLNNYETLGKIIKSARINKKLTQDQAAKLLEISPRHYQYIENDEKKPGYDLLGRIIHKLGISPDTIFFQQNETNNSNLAALIQKIRLCDEQKLSVIQATTDALLNM